ncbi:MAG TPA: hypothetical protein VFK32_03520 [Tepidiformaceae bacterium]|nr:hypothetical protein [Tepidiformaceae bacterium]
MRLTVDLEGETGPRTLPGDGEALVAFMSFAVVRGFGAQHPFIALADLLHSRKIPIGPLTTFYGATAEDSEDEEKLEMAWQDAAPLAESARALADVIESDPAAAALVRRAEAPGLGEQALALATIASEAAARPARVRLGYTL